MQKFKRDVLKALLAPLVKWKPLTSKAGGFSIILGVPWALRHLLRVNLRFVAKTDLRSLHRIHIVFDRVAQPGAAIFIAGVQREFPELPLHFRFHPPLSGLYVERINQSKFYASMNWTLGLGDCETSHAILHDFDLYPLAPHYFTGMIEAMREKSLRFTGVEFTHFDGLDASNALIGTWALGIDVSWLRGEYRPIDCFHAVEWIDGKRFDLDAFTFIQSKTSQRALTDKVRPEHMTHVRNLVSTYLRFSKGEHFDLVWRLHQLWYMESTWGDDHRLHQLTRTMDSADSPRLMVDGITADFSGTHVTCANVLRDQVLPMERFLHGGPRGPVLAYMRAFESFLMRHGKSDPIFHSDGSLRWSPPTAALSG